MCHLFAGNNSAEITNFETEKIKEKIYKSVYKSLKLLNYGNIQLYLASCFNQKQQICVLHLKDKYSAFPV